MKKVLLVLGSNLGDRSFYISAAIDAIEREVGKTFFCGSACETISWGFEAPPFLNRLIVINTILEPLSLLEKLQNIEKNLGRTPDTKTQYINGKTIYTNRTIDIDILDYEGIKFVHKKLTLPHQHLYNRPYLQQLLDEVATVYPYNLF